MFQEVSITLQFQRMITAFLINLSFIPIVLSIGIIIGLIIALIRFYKIPGLSVILSLLVDLIRGIPFLMIVYSVYFILPYVGISFGPYTTGIVVLSLTSSAFLSEIFLGGFRSIPEGQYMAATAIGMTFFQKLFSIIIPQMVKIVIPSLVGQIVMIVKDTSIVSLVGLKEVVRTSRQISQITLDPFLSFGIVALLFFAFCFPLIVLSKKLERKFSQEIID